MERIYFDKQIFSYLFKGDNPVYKSFLEEILNNKRNFLFVYSYAHILDLKNDKNDIKFKELEFMEKIVSDNYLQYEMLEKATTAYLMKPIEAFNPNGEVEEPFSLSNVFANMDFSMATPEQQNILETAKETLLNTEINLGLPALKDLPDDISSQLSKILPTNTTTILGLAEHLMSLVSSMDQDRGVYKGMRGMIDKYVNNGKFTVDYNNIDFNDDLKNSELKKTFLDFVNGNLNPSGTSDISKHDFFVNAYFSLDLLGISKEPAGKVKFRNVLNDGEHAYYGAYCDYVVSNDDGFLKKTRALYRLLGIATKVFHIDEFIGYFKLLSSSFESNPQVFFDLLLNDLNKGIVLGTKKALTRDRAITTIKTYHTYLGYFNEVYRMLDDNEESIILTRGRHNYSYFDFYRTYEGVINRAIKLFGVDSDYKGEYDFQKENAEIKEGKWIGRYWNFGKMAVQIEINKISRDLTLLVVHNN